MKSTEIYLISSIFSSLFIIRNIFCSNWYYICISVITRNYSKMSLRMLIFRVLQLPLFKMYLISSRASFLTCLSLFIFLYMSLLSCLYTLNTQLTQISLFCIYPQICVLFLSHVSGTMVR